MRYFINFILIISHIRNLMQIKKILEDYKVKNFLSNSKKEEHSESHHSYFKSGIVLYFDMPYMYYCEITHDLFMDEFFIRLSEIINSQNDIKEFKSLRAKQLKQFMDEFMKNSLFNAAVTKKKSLKKGEKLIYTVVKVIRRISSYLCPSDSDKRKYIAKKKFLDFVKKRKAKAYHKRFRTSPNNDNKDILYRSLKSIKKYFDKIISNMMSYKLSYILLAILICRFIYVYKNRKSVDNKSKMALKEKQALDMPILKDK